jgi:hypothetical protein
LPTPFHVVTRKPRGRTAAECESEPDSPETATERLTQRRRMVCGACHHRFQRHRCCVSSEIAAWAPPSWVSRAVGWAAEQSSAEDARRDRGSGGRCGQKRRHVSASPAGANVS